MTLELQVKEALDKGRVRVACQTCGLVFLNMSFAEYFNSSSQLVDSRKPDKWFIKTGLHYCDTDGGAHVIIADITSNPQNLTEVWNQKRAKDGLTLERMRAGLERQLNLALAERRPI